MAAKRKSWLGEFWRPLAALLLWVLGMVPLIAAPPLPSLAETRIGGLQPVPQVIAPADLLLSLDLHPACGPPLYDFASGCSVAPNRGAQLPVGRRGTPMTTYGNAPGEVGGRQYSGHAFDQMQGRGVPPSAVENTVRTGRASPDPIPGRSRHYDSVNDLTVVTDSQSGRVITVMTGER